MSELFYIPYDHYRSDKSNSAPLGATDTQIVGLELELAGVHTYAGLNEAIGDGILGTSDSPSEGIQLEYEAQSDVEFELVFNADSIENVLSRLSELNGYILGDFSNHRQCSAHVHVSREWLEDVRGISEEDFYKAAEAVAPLIYAVSGRDSNAWERWTPSNIEVGRNVLRRFEEIDQAVPNTIECRPECSHERYELCNCTNEETLEIRGFSNYCDNDEDTVRLFLEIAAGLIPDIAATMQGKEYARHYSLVFELVEAFLDEREWVTRRYGLPAWTNWRDAAAAKKRDDYIQTIEIYEDTQGYILRAINTWRDNPLEAAKAILNALEINSALELDSLNLKDIKGTALKLEEQNQKWFKNAIWRL